MERGTVLARMRTTIEFTHAARSWLRMYPDEWFARHDGNAFLQEFGGQWVQTVVPIVDEEVRRYFRELGVSDNLLPRVEVGDTYTGSFIIDLLIVMATARTAFNVLKGVSEIPQIADGLIDLRDLLSRKTQERLDRSVREQLRRMIDELRRESSPAPSPSRPLPQSPLVSVDYVIDARPLRSLSPAPAKSHRVHLSVAISRDSFTLENLGDEDMRDVRIGLFRSPTERQKWFFGDAYSSSVPLLSAHQTLMKDLKEFRDSGSSGIDLSDGKAVYVDCWVQDNHGIYLFNFFLEAE